MPDRSPSFRLDANVRLGGHLREGRGARTRTVRDLSAGSGLRFHSLGAHRLKGMPEDTEVFQVIRPEDVDFNAASANT
jgi:class 3 adenylate cyclase